MFLEKSLWGESNPLPFVDSEIYETNALPDELQRQGIKE